MTKKWSKGQKWWKEQRSSQSENAVMNDDTETIHSV